MGYIYNRYKATWEWERNACVNGTSNEKALVNTNAAAAKTWLSYVVHLILDCFQDLPRLSENKRVSRLTEMSWLVLSVLGCCDVCQFQFLAQGVESDWTQGEVLDLLARDVRRLYWGHWVHFLSEAVEMNSKYSSRGDETKPYFLIFRYLWTRNFTKLTEDKDVISLCSHHLTKTQLLQR